MTNRTKSFIQELFSSVAQDNFGASFGAALSDNLVWTVTGSSPIAGTYNGKSTYMKQVSQAVGLPERARLDESLTTSR